MEKIAPENNFLEYLEIISAAGEIFVNFSIENAVDFRKICKTQAAMVSKFKKSSQKVWTFWALFRKFLKKIKKFILKPPPQNDDLKPEN